MKPKFPKVKKVKKSTLKNKADKVFSLFVRSKGYCELAYKDRIRCGGALQTMHIITRGVTGLRYETNNALCGCQGHHVYYTFHPDEWVRLVADLFPEKWKFVSRYKNTRVKKTEDLYREVIERYKETP